MRKGIGTLISLAVSAMLAMGFGMSTPALAGNLAFSQTVANTDFAMFGQGGLRGNTAGSIVVSGVTGSVTRALLIWHGPTAAGNATNAALTFAGVARVGTLIGVSDDNIWAPFTESRAYIADVTASVPGDGAYALTGLANSALAGMNGASLLVFYNDGNAANNRDIVLFDGNDSNQPNAFDANGWAATLNGINYAGGTATLRLVVSDGQNSFLDNGLNANASQLLAPGQNWAGATVPNAAGSSVLDGGLWDHTSHDVAPFLVPGLNNLALTSLGGSNDALSLIAAIFDLPAGAAPPPPPPPAGPQAEIPTLSEWALLLLAAMVALLGAGRLRSREQR